MDLNKICFANAKKLKSKCELPATVCCCGKGLKHAYDRSGCLKESDYHIMLRNELVKLGTIGKKGNNCGNIVGFCSEQRAANKLIKRNNGLVQSLNQIEFSDAVRPRTMQKIAHCKNCRTVFPQL